MIHGMSTATRIRIARVSPSYGHWWYAERVGQEFNVVEFREGRPSFYEVDISCLKEAGEMTVNRASVPKHDAEPVQLAPLHGRELDLFAQTNSMPFTVRKT